MKPKIYLCGPYTKPDQCVNTYKAIQLGNRLLTLGYTPFIPHLTHFWHSMSPKDYEVWMDYDQEWITSCQALLRFPGESMGADREIMFAQAQKIPVYYSLEELLTKMPPK